MVGCLKGESGLVVEKSWECGEGLELLTLEIFSHWRRATL